MNTYNTSRWSKVIFSGLLVLGLIGCAAAGGHAIPDSSTTGDAAVLQAPLKIPMPLDRAGHKIDVTFDIPEPPKGERARGYFLGLRILFTPAMGQVQLLDAHPVAVRATIHRVQSGSEQTVEFVRLERIGSPHGPGQYVPVPIKDAVAVARGMFSEGSGAAKETAEASTYVMEFAAPRDSSAGRFRLRVETLIDLPSLVGFKAFLALEQAPKR